MSDQTWTLVRASYPEIPEDWASYIQIFEDHGVAGTVQTDRPVTLGGYLYQGTGVEELSNALMSGGAEKVETFVVAEEDWDATWKKFFHTTRIGKHIVIRPEWEVSDLKPGELEIVLDPGQAFGTGDHPTTRMCLELLEVADLHGKSVADIGCGSGILSVAAKKLGASRVIGIDNDQPSVDASLENSVRNGVTYEVINANGFAGLDGEQFDVVVSNIISATLIRVAPDAAKTVKPGGTWCVSGIIQANWPEVRTSIEAQGFTYQEERQEGDWIAALFQR
jgi:ribosomal protein L11 methyltransferase